MLLYFSNKALNNFLSWYLSSDGDSKVQIYTNTIGLLCFIILSYLINDLNYVSLAIILAISQTIIFIYLLFSYLKSNSLSRLRLNFVIVIIIQLIVCLLVYFFNKLMINSINNFILNYFIFLSFQIIFSSILLFSQKFRKNIILIYKFFRYE